MKTPTTKYLKDYRPPAYWIDTIDLQFDLAEDESLVTATMKIRRNNDIATQTTPLVFNARDIDILSVVANDMVLCTEDYELSAETFTLPRVPEQFILEIKNRLKPQDNTALEGLYKSGSTFCTQCEAQGFRRITCFPDRPDVMPRFSCIITADKSKYPVLLSNGNPVDRGDLEDNRHYVKWEDPFKKPSYLFALVAGDLTCIEDHFTTCSGRDITLQIFVEHENKEKCGHAMKSLKESMTWDEERFGREYDLDLYQIVAVNDFNMGAMENKGLNIFNSKYVLAKTETATDNDFMNIQRVIGHEYFHNWTGNRITLKNWFQLSLKEGLTVFRDQEFSSDLNNRAVQRIDNVRKLRTYQFPEDAGPMAHPVRPESYIEMNNFYTMTVYEKGAEVIRMMYELLGRDSFRKGMDLYFERFDGQAVTTEDFVKTMEASSGMDLSQFALWYAQSGTPRVTVSRTYDAKNRTLSVTMTQETPPDANQTEKSPLHIPVKYGLVFAAGHKDALNREEDLMLHLKSARQTFHFKDVPEETLPSLFRGFSAPVILNTDFTAEELATLMAHDADAFNRWEAAQQLYFMEFRKIVETLQSNKESHNQSANQSKTRPKNGSIKPSEKNRQHAAAVSDHLIKAFKVALCDESLDRSLIARTLTLPDEGEIGQQYDPIDVEAIHNARQRIKQTIATTLKSEIDTLILRCAKADPTDLSHEAMADRSLKNVLLGYLGSLDEKTAHETLFSHYIHARNMTDEIAALSILCNSSCDDKMLDEALSRFHAKWHEDPLVLDKWFSVQAASTRPGTLERIKELTIHPEFSWRNPNRVRSVMAVLGNSNPYIFHQVDGAGYAFFAEKVIDLDTINSQIAARLVSAFNRWKKYDEKRRDMMKNQLEQILNTPNLSRDVFEIVSKALR